MKAQLRLVVDIHVEIPEEEVADCDPNKVLKDLEQNLLHIPSYAAGEGWMTRDTVAEIDSWGSRVENVTQDKKAILRTWEGDEVEDQEIYVAEGYNFDKGPFHPDNELLCPAVHNRQNIVRPEINEVAIPDGRCERILTDAETRSWKCLCDRTGCMWNNGNNDCSHPHSTSTAPLEDDSDD